VTRWQLDILRQMDVMDDADILDAAAGILYRRSRKRTGVLLSAFLKVLRHQAEIIRRENLEARKS